MPIAIAAALLAGACFAAGGVLQQREASARPDREALSVRLLIDLAHDPLWWLGIGFAFVSYVLEALALSFGPLVLVQPLIVTELLFALPISVRWRGMRMTRREWSGTVAVAAGLAVGIAASSPSAGRPTAPPADWATALGAVACLALLAVATGRARTGPARSSLFALGAAVVLGTQAALLKATVARFEHGVAAALESWELWGMVAAALVGLLLVQSAFEAGPLATSLPGIDAVEAAGGITFGIVLLHEDVRTGDRLIGVGVALALLLAGILVLDTSPLVSRLQRVERRQRQPEVARTAESAGPRARPPR